MRQSFQIATVLIAIVLIARFDLFLSSFLVFGLRDFHHLDHSFAKPPCYFTTQKTRVIHRQVSKSQMQINSYPFIRLSTPTTYYTYPSTNSLLSSSIPSSGTCTGTRVACITCLNSPTPPSLVARRTLSLRLYCIIQNWPPGILRAQKNPGHEYTGIKLSHPLGI